MVYTSVAITSGLVLTIVLFGLYGGANHNNVQMKLSGSARCVWKLKRWRSHVDAHQDSQCSSCEASRHLGCGAGIFFTLNLTTSHINPSLSCKTPPDLYFNTPVEHQAMLAFLFLLFFSSSVFLVNYFFLPPFWKWKHIVSRRMQLRYRFWICAVKSLRVPPFMGSQCRHASAC